jgi:hypothetical protein
MGVDVMKLKQGDPVTFKEGDADVKGIVHAVQLNPTKMVDVVVNQKGHAKHGLVVKVHPETVSGASAEHEPETKGKAHSA